MRGHKHGPHHNLTPHTRYFTYRDMWRTVHVIAADEVVVCART